MFVSMWACLFGEVEQAHPSSEERDYVLKLLKSPEATVQIEACQHKHRVAPCPMVLVRVLPKSVVLISAKRSVADQAATMQSTKTVKVFIVKMKGV